VPLLGLWWRVAPIIAVFAAQISVISGGNPDLQALKPGENGQYGVGDLVDLGVDVVEPDTQTGIAFQIGIPFRIDDRTALRAIPMFRLDFERRSKGIGHAHVVDGHTHPDRSERLCRIFQREAGIEVLFLTHGHSIEWFLRTFFKGRSLQLPRLFAVRVICPGQLLRYDVGVRC